MLLPIAKLVANASRTRAIGRSRSAGRGSHLPTSAELSQKRGHRALDSCDLRFEEFNDLECRPDIALSILAEKRISRAPRPLFSRSRPRSRDRVFSKAFDERRADERVLRVAWSY